MEQAVGIEQVQVLTIRFLCGFAGFAEGRYPTASPMVLDTTANAKRDDCAEFWEAECRNIDSFLSSRLSAEGPDGRPIDHISLLALAPIPLLMYFGHRLGDIMSLDVYRRHRDTADWQWAEAAPEDSGYIVECPESPESGATDVGLELSLSDHIDAATICDTAPDDAPWYRIAIARPRPDFLKAKCQLQGFGEVYRELLSRIRADIGANCKVHLFPAVPNSIAVEIGRRALPKRDAEFLVWDSNARCGGWVQAISV